MTDSLKKRLRRLIKRSPDLYPELQDALSEALARIEELEAKAFHQSAIERQAARIKELETWSREDGRTYVWSMKDIL